MPRELQQWSRFNLYGYFALLAVTLVANGCAGPQYGGYVSKYGRPLSDPTSPPVSVTIEPEQTTNPVKTQQTLKAIVRDADGKPVYSAMVEWILARANGAVGDIIEVKQDPLQRAMKLTNTYALAGADRRGEAAVTITSVQEGTTHVIAVVPDIKDPSKHKAFAVLNWLDAQWEFPGNLAQRVGTKGILATRVSRASSGKPLAGYTVKWNITSGPPAFFEENGQQELVTETDQQGIARATIAQRDPAPGGNAVHISVIKPEESGKACCPSVSGVIAQDRSAVEWVAPTLAIQQDCPPASVLGVSAPFSFSVTNASDIEATDVKITATLPQGAELVSASPPALIQGNTIAWLVKQFPARHTVHGTIELKPTTPGTLTHDITVVTQDGYRTTSTCTSKVGQATLSLTHECPQDGILGDSLTFTTTVKNTGNAEAKNVRLIHEVPEGFTHSSGARVITKSIESLPPGGIVLEKVQFVAQKTGPVTSVAVVEGDGLRDSARCEINILQPSIGIKKTGPEKRFLNTPVTYEIVINNSGTAPATGVVVNDTLPSGIQYESSVPGGTFNAATNGLTWDIGTMAPGTSQTLSVTGRAVSSGRQCNAASVRTSRELRESAQACTEVEGVAALLIEVTDSFDPMEVGATETYSIVVTNQGTAPTTNVKISAQLTDAMEYVSSEGSTARLIVLGKRVDFDPIPSLAPKKSVTFKVTVRGTEAGDHRFRVSMEADQLTSPVIEEESTKFYK